MAAESIPDSLQSKLEHYKFGNLYDTGSAYSIENYCVIAQAYNLINKELLANTLRHKNNNMLEQITQEYTQLTAEIGYISKNCMSTLEWKKLYD